MSAGGPSAAGPGVPHPLLGIALIVGASDDAIVPVGHSRDLARLMPQARLIEMQGGHFLPQTQTLPYVNEVKAFLAGPV